MLFPHVPVLWGVVDLLPMVELPRSVSLYYIAWYVCPHERGAECTIWGGVCITNVQQG